MLSENIMWAVLSRLEEEYPNPIQKSKEILPDLSEKEVIFKHLAYLLEEKYITAKPVRHEKMILDYEEIKITSLGIDYLATLTPLQE